MLQNPNITLKGCFFSNSRKLLVAKGISLFYEAWPFVLLGIFLLERCLSITMQAPNIKVDFAIRK